LQARASDHRSSHKFGPSLEVCEARLALNAASADLTDPALAPPLVGPTDPGPGPDDSSDPATATDPTGFVQDTLDAIKEIASGAGQMIGLLPAPPPPVDFLPAGPDWEGGSSDDPNNPNAGNWGPPVIPPVSQGPVKALSTDPTADPTQNSFS
jgi:hypothetical protein